MTMQSTTPVTREFDLSSRYPVTREQIEQFNTEGFIKLKDVLPADVIEYYRREIAAKVREFNTLHLPMEQRTTYQKAFLQVTNIWTKSAVVKEFVFSKRLARLATELLQVNGVRMYHDQALYKEKGGGVTPWHADQYYWPLSTDRTVTAWIPLQKTTREMGPLAFAARSQTLTFGRELPISDESEKRINEALKAANFTYVDEPFDLREVSFHLGWTFHRAGPNRSDRAREVMTVIYMDKDIRMTEPRNAAHKADIAAWMAGTKPGEIPNTPLTPIMYSRDED